MDYPILVCPLDIGLLKQLWRATLRDNACGIRVSIYPILETRQLDENRKMENGNLLSGQSSPGILQAEQQASKGTRQMPHTSSSSSSCWAGVRVSQRH